MKPTPHPFSLRQLQYIVAVAEQRSFRRAAALCGVSQPSLSAQVAATEDALGARLFERDPRRVLLTPVGEALLPLARQLLLQADDLAEAARRFDDPLAGTLRMGVIPTMSPYLLPDLVPALRRQHARLTVLWTEEKTDVLVSRLYDGALDGALLALEARIGGAELERVVLGEDPFVLVTPPGDELGSQRGPARVSELRDQNVLLLDDGHCLRDQALSVCTRGRAHEVNFRATSLPTLVQMVAAGAGVTLLPRLAFATEARSADLRVRRLAAPVPHRTLAVVWRRQSTVAPAVRAVATCAEAAYAKLIPKLEKALPQA